MQRLGAYAAFSLTAFLSTSAIAEDQEAPEASEDAGEPAPVAPQASDDAEEPATAADPADPDDAGVSGAAAADPAAPEHDGEPPAVAAPEASENAEASAAPGSLDLPAYAENSVYVELGGNAGFYSVNYERYFTEDAALRVGAMFMSLSVSGGSGSNSASSSGSWAALPVTFSFLGLRAGSHALELGGGLVPMYGEVGVSSGDTSGNASAFTVAGTAVAGYRFAPSDGGFVFRAGFTPLYFVGAGSDGFLPWGGLSFGYRF